MAALRAEADRDPDEMEMVGGLRGTFPDHDPFADLGRALDSFPEP